MIQLVHRLSNWLALMSRLPDIEAMKQEGNISALKQALEHPVAKVRWAATRALGDLWHIPDLAKLGHPDSKIRASAAEVLGQSRDYRVMAPLIAALHDPVISYTDELNRSVYPVRISAISALCEIGDPIAIDPLLEALSGESWYGQTLGFQGKLGENLVKMGSPMLLRCIALLQSPDVMTRQQAIYVLECFDAAQTVELHAGDVLLFHCRLFHAAGRNTTEQVKLSPVFTYHRADNHPIPGTRSAAFPSIAVKG